MSNKLILLWIISILVIVVIVILTNKAVSDKKAVTSKKPDLLAIRVGNKKIPVELARTNEEKGLGLSGRTDKDFPPDRGMLFVFTNPESPAFWMHGMNFPLDIVWINTDVVVSVDKNIPNPAPGVPDSTLKYYVAPVPVNYVLELHSGFTDRFKIKAGDKVEINI